MSTDVEPGTLTVEEQQPETSPSQTDAGRRINWLRAIGDTDILRDATSSSAVFWYRAGRGKKWLIGSLILLVALAACILPLVLWGGPDWVGVVLAGVVLVFLLYHGWFIYKFLPSRNDRIVLGLRKFVREEVEPLEAGVQQFSEEELRAKTDEFRQRLAAGEPIDAIRPEAYACVREASMRARRHRQYECQLIGGKVIEDNSVAEMRTGEGKTIVCYMANYLKALQGLKVHMVTVNDYLVKRDAEFCRPIFEMLGISVGYISNDMPTWGAGVEVRRQAYASDITYGTNSEFGFDYLRDNMKMSVRDQVQGKQDFVVVDEVDSILIDEARVPLIISGPTQDNASDYSRADHVARSLIAKQDQANRQTASRLDDIERDASKDQKADAKFKDGIKKFRADPFWLSSDEAEAIGHSQFFVVELDSKAAHMTDAGAKSAQQELGIGTFYDSKNMNWPHHIDNSLKAHKCYLRDKDYIVQDKAIVIVDPHTGRLMEGRQWSDGLHQAVEAKERVTIKQETQTLATITLQNLFKMYRELAGMTGTAMTEADEFMKIYRLDVIAIPTNKPIRRVDYNDRIYRTGDEKYDAIVEEIHSQSQNGYPADPLSVADMLVQADRTMREYTDSDEVDRETLSSQLAVIRKTLDEFRGGRGDPEGVFEGYRALMGDDLGGRPVLVGTASVETSEKLSNLLTRRYGLDHEVLNARPEAVAREAEIVAKAGQQHEIKRGKRKEVIGNVTIATNMAGRGTDIVLGPRVGDYGGLHVVGSERHESRRIDNQLRGRSGRQGDPGSSRFFLSFDDELLRLFMGEWVLKMLNRFSVEGEPIEAPAINRGIANAQKKVEERNFSVRKNLLEYDEVMDHQRKTFYTLRQRVVEGRGLSDLIWEMIDESVIDAINRFYDRGYPGLCVTEWVTQHLGVQLDPDRLDVESFDELQDQVRDMASYEIRSTVQRTFGEYIDPDIPAEEWDVRNLVNWAATYDLSLTQNQVRQTDPHELQEEIVTAAERKVMAEDLAPLEQYVDPLYAKARLVRWARDKFDVDLALEDLRAASADEAQNIIGERMRQAYKRREIEYPVGAIIDFAIQRGGSNKNEVYARIANWCNRKFGFDWTYEHFLGKDPKQVFEELRQVNEEFLTGDKYHDEIERVLREHTGDALDAWSKQRFGTILDTHPLDLDGDLRAQLQQCFYEMLRFELTFVERMVLLNTLDAVWKDHMYAMDLLRSNIGLRGYAERDPKIEYKREGTRLFSEMQASVRDRVTDLIFKVHITAGPETGDGPAGGPVPTPDAPSEGGGMAYGNMQAQKADATGTGYAGAEADRAAAMQQQGEQTPTTIRNEQPKVGRNDPCPCGSGKKFKHCHGKT